MKFEKGKKVRVVGNSNGHNYTIGRIVTMKSYDGYEDFIAEEKEGLCDWYVKFSDCEEIEDKPQRYKSREVNIDPIVTRVMTQLLTRSQLGICKYGTTLEDNNEDDFLQHLKEELMDAILYIEKLQSQE